MKTTADSASTQKPPRFPSAACVVALRLRRGLPRRAVLERSPSLPPTGRTTFMNDAVDASSHEAVDALPVCRGQRYPRCDYDVPRATMLIKPVLLSHGMKQIAPPPLRR